MEYYYVKLVLIVSIVVVLPIAIVLINSLTNKAKYEKKFSFLEKCIENGVEINPDLIIDKDKLSPRANLKTILLNRLAGGVSFSLFGIILLTQNGTYESMFLGIALTAVGIGLLVWYFVGKKMLAEDIQEEKEILAQKENRSSK